MDYNKINKIYSSIKSGKTIKENSQNLGITEIELYGLIELLNTLYNKKIELITTEDNEIVIIKKQIRKVQKEIKPPKEECIYSKFLLVSDTHLGNNRQQLHILNDLYEIAYQKEIDTVYHCGDLVDGDYSSVRKEQSRQVFLHGFDEQAGYVVDMYPQINGITTKFILGSHDETHYKNGQATLGYWIPKCRSKDMVYLGQDQVLEEINGVKIMLDHPGGGSAYALSYNPQKRIEELESGYKPKILAIGHYHKFYTSTYRNVHVIEVPCTCDKTPFQIKKGLSNIVGGVFVECWSDEKGNIEYLSCEEKLYGREDMWDEVGKDAHKVKRLVR